MTATPEIVMPSQMRNQRRMVRASSVAGSRKGDMGCVWWVTLLTVGTGLADGCAEVPAEGGVMGESFAPKALGGEGVVEVAVAGEGDGSVGGVAVPVFGVAGGFEDESGGAGGDLVGLAIQGSAEEVDDLGGGIRGGWGGVHGGQQVRSKCFRVM